MDSIDVAKRITLMIDLYNTEQKIEKLKIAKDELVKKVESEISVDELRDIVSKIPPDDPLYNKVRRLYTRYSKLIGYNNG